MFGEFVAPNAKFAPHVVLIFCGCGFKEYAYGEPKI